MAIAGDRSGASDDEVRAAASACAAAAVPLSRLEQIVSEQSVPLARTLALVVLDRQVAADIAQETFLRLYVHWDEVSKHPDLTAWLYRVAFNRAKDHRRALARAARGLERLKAGAAADATRVGSAPPWEPDPDFIRALQSLSRQQRTAAMLHYMGDLTVSQTARVMGISEGAAKSHLHRAHQTLRELLEGM
jgi:RNA polymerase sigma factor (sigma-70 family)